MKMNKPAVKTYFRFIKPPPQAFNVIFEVLDS